MFYCNCGNSTEEWEKTQEKKEKKEKQQCNEYKYKYIIRLSFQIVCLRYLAIIIIMILGEHVGNYIVLLCNVCDGVNVNEYIYVREETKWNSNSFYSGLFVCLFSLP